VTNNYPAQEVQRQGELVEIVVDRDAKDLDHLIMILPLPLLFAGELRYPLPAI